MNLRDAIADRLDDYQLRMRRVTASDAIVATTEREVDALCDLFIQWMLQPTAIIAALADFHDYDGYDGEEGQMHAAICAAYNVATEQRT